VIAAPRYAVFASPHGFGHAARTSAVMAALHERNRAEFEVFTTVPTWFFDESIAGRYRYHEVECDVGFRQQSALVADIDATVEALGAFLPFDDRLVDRLAQRVQAAGCRAVLCDISPLGIAVAERAGLPSLLVESFQWPWLYAPFHERVPELVGLSAELDRWWGLATIHVQTEPLCWRDPVRLLVGPISRKPRQGRSSMRIELEIDPGATVVTVTMGGYGEDMPYLDRLREMSDLTFLITGADRTHRQGNLLFFDNQTRVYMPDVLRASDALVAKLGYGIVAEAWHEGLPLLSVSREDFREMRALEEFSANELTGFGIQTADFRAGTWIDRIPELLACERRPHEGDAADEVAQLLEGLGATS